MAMSFWCPSAVCSTEHLAHALVHNGKLRAGAALLVCAACLVLPVPAMAAEWKVAGSLSQRFEAQTDRTLSGEEDPVFGSTTRLGMGFTRAAPTSELSVEAGVSASAFGGPGDTQGLNRIDPSLSAEYTSRWKRVDASAVVDFGFRPVSIAQAEDSGVTADDATQLNIRLGSNVGYALDAANRVFVGADAGLVRFTSNAPSLAETTTLGLDAGWEHQVNRRFAVNLGTGASFFVSDNAANSRSFSFDVTAGANYQLNSRLGASGEAGVEVTRTRNTVNGQRQGEVTVGLTANAAVNWLPAPDTTTSFSMSQNLEPSSLGELQTITRFSFESAYQVNSQIAAEFGAAYQRQTSAGGFESNGTRRQLATVTSGINFTLTRDWGVRAGYTLRHEFEDSSGSGGEGSSHLVFVQITRDLQILP